MMGEQADKQIKLGDRMQAAVPVLLARLPRRVKRKIAGDPVEIDNQQLDLDSQVLLKMMSKRTPLEAVPPAQGREDHRRIAAARKRLHCERVEDLVIPGSRGDIGARLYIPTAAKNPGPLMVYYHGGGFVIGDLDTHDNFCRLLAETAGVRVLAIDYHLAPEFPFPAAVDDSVAAFEFAVANADVLGADPARISVGGDSAGGNLAATVSQIMTSQGSTRPNFQFLIYPSLDRGNPIDTESRKLFSDLVLTKSVVEFFVSSYLPEPWMALDLRSSPGRVEKLSGLPAAYIVSAGMDPLRDGAEDYGRRLNAAGVPATVVRYPGFIHGFATWLHIPACQKSVLDIAAELKVALSSAAPSEDPLQAARVPKAA